MLVIVQWIAFMIKPIHWCRAVTVSKGDNVSGSALSMLRKLDLHKALVISGLVLSFKDLFVAYFPLLGTKPGITAGTIGVLLSFRADMAIIIRLSQVVLVRRFSRGHILTATLILSGIAYLFIPFTSHLLLLALLITLLGAGLGLGQPLTLVLALNITPLTQHGMMLGMRLTFNRAFQLTAPLVFGGIVLGTGASTIFWACSGTLFISSYFTHIREYQPDTCHTD